jgi:hypothetical protein
MSGGGGGLIGAIVGLGFAAVALNIVSRMTEDMDRQRHSPRMSYPYNQSMINPKRPKRNNKNSKTARKKNGRMSMSNFTDYM